MVAQPTDICSLDRLRLELRLAVDETYHDTLLLDQLASAVGWVEASIDYPLVDRASVLTTNPPMGAMNALVFEARGFKSLQSIAYFSPSSEGEWIETDDWGDVETTVTPTTDVVVVNAPPAGWPAHARDLRWRLNVTLGLTLGRRPKDTVLAQALVLLVRQLYNGGGLPNDFRALDRLLGPLRPLHAAL